MTGLLPPQGIAALGARAIAGGVRSGDFTAEAVAQAFLDRIATYEPQVQAWHYLDVDRALAEARAVDAAGGQTPLAGVPIGVKDVIDTADMPTGYGSAAYEGSRPAADAPCVCLSRAAGAVALGKTVSTEFAMFSPGKTRNPRNPDHTPGGSSSGSAAAVAAGMVPLAFGTQTSGSVIRPAAFCGVVGFKPTFNMFARNGIKMLSDSLDTLGIIGRTVDDVGFFASVLASRPALDAPVLIEPPRIGVFRTSRWARADIATAAAIAHAADAAADRGAAVVEVPVPDWFDGLFDAQDAVMSFEVTRTLAYERLRLADRITAATRDGLAARAGVTFAAYEAAQRLADEARSQQAILFGDCDVLLTTAAPGEAPAGLSATGDPLFNRVWTLLHMPCVTVPAGFGPPGLPLGAQLVGRVGDDARLLATASFLEAALAATTDSFASQPALAGSGANQQRTE